MGPTLHLDAASPAICVGLSMSDDEKPCWIRVRDEAGVALFRAVETLLSEQRVPVADVETAIFCEGPGSLLGVRLAAMALRTWGSLPRKKPLRVSGYRSLELIAATLLDRGEVGPFHVIADGRRATWNVLSVGEDGSWGAIRRHGAAEPLPAARSVFHPRDFPLWQALPPGVMAVDYEPERLSALANRFSLLRPVSAPDAFMTEMPTYREWTPEHPVRTSRK